MELFLLILLVVIVVSAIATVLMYNGLVRGRNTVDETWAQIDVQLKRRHDLIPNLVNAVKGYMGFEQQVLASVTEARANAVAAGRGGGPQAQAAAENQLTGALRSLFAVAENYPQLRANENVLSLQAQLSETENGIAGARERYNSAVRAYNTSIQTFPANTIAGTMGFGSREFFEAEPEAAATPGVELR